VSANVTDGGTLSYQWYSNTSASNIGGTVISGATSPSYNPPTGMAGTYFYFVEITNIMSDNGDGGVKTATVRSNAVTLTVNEQVNAQVPNITSHPVSGTITNNTSYSLSVSVNVTDGGTLSYQWYSNTSASNVGGTVISGATSASYIPPTGTTGTYYYFVEVTNTIPNNGDGGIKTVTARSNAVTLTVLEGQGTVAITITFSQIADVSLSITEPTLYRVSNGGPTSATLNIDNPGQYDINSITWRVGSTNVTGTGSSFTLSATNTAYNQIGEHFITVFVRKGGVPYNKTVSFRVEY
jgi:hypothetical protein